MSRKKPVCHQSRVIARSKLFKIEALDLQFSNGAVRQFERISGNGPGMGAVIIIAINDNNAFYLIREYAAGTEKYELAFPKGLIDPGETMLEAANRELQEEVGFAARELKLLRSMSLAPGYFGAHMDVVLATDLYPSVLPGDEPEPIEVIEWPIETSEQLLHEADFSESRSIAALYIVQHWLKQQSE
ncbi:ADP compounds hydrolase NudE [Legionella sp. W05-934-2]|jgi:ADP-ribose diphosphatase|uniref:ADP compounds hydrolase NudE n=1 Tax=Legionella sp. W05-934-2 TaxID=1198649 RepID=UPI0034622CF4